MPRGIPNKKKEEVKEAIIDEAKEEAAPVLVETPKAPPIPEETENPAGNIIIPELPKPEKPKLEPLSVGQAYFEAPDGTVVIADATKDQTWYRAGNHGKGMWINKKR